MRKVLAQCYTEEGKLSVLFSWWSHISLSINWWEFSQRFPRKIQHGTNNVSFLKSSFFKKGRLPLPWISGTLELWINTLSTGPPTLDDQKEFWEASLRPVGVFWRTPNPEEDSGVWWSFMLMNIMAWALVTELPFSLRVWWESSHRFPRRQGTHKVFMLTNTIAWALVTGLPFSLLVHWWENWWERNLPIDFPEHRTACAVYRMWFS